MTTVRPMARSAVTNCRRMLKMLRENSLVVKNERLKLMSASEDIAGTDALVDLGSKLADPGPYMSISDCGHGDSRFHLQRATWCLLARTRILSGDCHPA